MDEISMTSEADIRALLGRIIESHTGIHASQIKLSSKPADLGIDSLTRLQILVDVEDALEVEIPDSGLSQEASFEAILQVILRAMEESDEAGITNKSRALDQRRV